MTNHRSRQESPRHGRKLPLGCGRAPRLLVAGLLGTVSFGRRESRCQSKLWVISFCPLQISGVGSAQGLTLHVASKRLARRGCPGARDEEDSCGPSSSVPSAPCLQSSRSTASPLTGGKGKLQRPGQLVTVTSWEGNPGLLGPEESQSPRPEPLCLLPDLARGPVNASLSHALTAAPGTCFPGSGGGAGTSFNPEEDLSQVTFGRTSLPPCTLPQVPTGGHRACTRPRGRVRWLCPWGDRKVTREKVHLRAGTFLLLILSGFMWKSHI